MTTLITPEVRNVISEIKRELPLYTNLNEIEVGDLARFPWMKAEDSIVEILEIEHTSDISASICWRWLGEKKVYYSTTVMYGTQWYGDINKRWYKRSEDIYPIVDSLKVKWGIK